MKTRILTGFFALAALTLLVVFTYRTDKAPPQESASSAKIPLLFAKQKTTAVSSSTITTSPAETIRVPGSETKSEETSPEQARLAAEIANEHEKLQNIAATFLKSADLIESEWKKYRIDMYLKAGLSPQDISDLDAILERYELADKRLQEKYDRATPEGQKNLALLMSEQRDQANQAAAAFLGPKRTEYVKQARAAFNKSFQKRFKNNIETTSW